MLAVSAVFVKTAKVCEVDKDKEKEGMSLRKEITCEEGRRAEEQIKGSANRAIPVPQETMAVDDVEDVCAGDITSEIATMQGLTSE